MRTFVFAAMTLAIAVTASPAASAQLTRKVCQDIAAVYGGQGAAYQPGVDARGRRVVGAEANQAGFVAPTPTAIDISVLLPKSIVQPKDAQVRGEVPISRFAVHQDGSITYAGQRLGVAEQQAVQGICHRFYGPRPR